MPWRGPVPDIPPRPGAALDQTVAQRPAPPPLPPSLSPPDQSRGRTCGRGIGGVRLRDGGVRGAVDGGVAVRGAVAAAGPYDRVCVGPGQRLHVHLHGIWWTRQTGPLP